SESRRCLRTSLTSTASRMCEPPCRSSPSTRRRCNNEGQPLTVSGEMKLGITKEHTTNAVSRIARAFQREKCSMPRPPSIRRQLAAVLSFDRILTAAPHDALLDQRELCRQRAGTQQGDEIDRRLGGEIAGDLSAPAEDRVADHRSRDHLV